MVAASVASLLKHRVRFELECIDRMYLNLYVPGLQRPEGLVGFLRQQAGVKVYSTNSIAPMTEAFIGSIERFVRRHGLRLIDFEKGQRKEEVALEYRKRFRGKEGVLFVGRAQEKARVFRTVKRRDAGGVYPWIVMGNALTGPAHLRPPHQSPYSGALPHLRGHARRRSFAAHQLQAVPHQAVPQGRPGAAHRDRRQ